MAAYGAGAPGSCAFPAMQGVTPIEGTCCKYQGGPDVDGDWDCDANPANWTNTPGWQDVGFWIPDSHAFVYAYSTISKEGQTWFRAAAYADLDCDVIQSTFYRFARPVDVGGACAAEAVPGLYVENETE